MERDVKEKWLPRALTGATLGILACLLLAWLTQPGAILGGSLQLDFTFCYNSKVPEALGAVCGIGLWALFGAEVGVATLPFADDGRELVVRSLFHYLVTSLTVTVWVVLNFFQMHPLSSLPSFLIPLTLVYLIVWLGRWVGWYAEVAAIREKLGLAPGPSPFHWKETLPYFGFALLLCDLLPLVLRVFDATDFPVLVGILLPYLLLPVGGFMSGLSLGKRQGFCPLYPLACGLFYVPIVFLLMNSSALFHCFMVAVPALAGNLAGAAYTAKRRKGGRAA